MLYCICRIQLTVHPTVSDFGNPGLLKLTIMAKCDCKFFLKEIGSLKQAILWLCHIMGNLTVFSVLLLLYFLTVRSLFSHRF